MENVLVHPDWRNSIQRDFYCIYHKHGHWTGLRYHPKDGSYSLYHSLLTGTENLWRAIAVGDAEFLLGLSGMEVVEQLGAVYGKASRDG